MRFPTLLVALTLMATFPYQNSEGLPKARSASEMSPPARSISANSPEPDATVVSPGDRAPDFAYIGADGFGGRLRNLLAQGPVLLVFGAGESDLAALRARP